ncbi:outer membrane protein assembly factor BamE [Reinekea thalattae]|uniref:Outer membrane protein assembly factor BamE n=1 Tax=Reinekea thalattae TaxID=2593301 RepID=A0A5C8ZAB4_9GAMM|nr:outer membrane protein assembly factor BamE [Reinekea thalattae]
MFIRLSKYALFFSFSLILTSCGLLKPYQAELGQGNFVQQEQLDQLSIGMTKDQVTFLLGTPMLSGLDTEQHWIYTTYSDAAGYASLVIEFTEGNVSAIRLSDNFLTE